MSGQECLNWDSFGLSNQVEQYTPDNDEALKIGQIKESPEGTGETFLKMFFENMVDSGWPDDIFGLDKSTEVYTGAESTASSEIVSSNELLQLTNLDLMNFDEGFGEESQAQSGESSQSSSQNLDGNSAEKKTRKHLSPYMLYSKENFHTVKLSVTPGHTSNVGKEMGRRWNNLSPEEKQIYIDKAKELKQQGGSTVPAAKHSGVKKTQRKQKIKKLPEEIAGSISLAELTSGTNADVGDSQKNFLNQSSPPSLGRPMSVESMCSADSSRSPLCPSYVLLQNQQPVQHHQGIRQILPEPQHPLHTQPMHLGQPFTAASQQIPHKHGNYMQQPLCQRQLPQSFAFQNGQSLNSSQLGFSQGIDARLHPQSHYYNNEQMPRPQPNFSPMHDSVPAVMAMKRVVDVNALMNTLRSQDEEIKSLKNQLRSATAANYNLMNVLNRHGLIRTTQNGYQNLPSNLF